jgi:hypothetical protein
MLKKILLAGAALATLTLPATANAQRYYGRSYGTYSHGRHYYWDGHHYRDRDSNAIIDAVIGGLLGYAVGSLAAPSYGYGYSYPSYSYSYPSYGYGNYYNSYPSYGYGGYYNSYPGYNYCYNAYGRAYRC